MSIAAEVMICLTDFRNDVNVVWQATSDGTIGSVDLPYWLQNSEGWTLEPIALIAQNSIIPLKLLAAASGGN